MAHQQQAAAAAASAVAGRDIPFDNPLLLDEHLLGSGGGTGGGRGGSGCGGGGNAGVVAEAALLAFSNNCNGVSSLSFPAPDAPSPVAGLRPKTPAAYQQFPASVASLAAAAGQSAYANALTQTPPGLASLLANSRRASIAGVSACLGASPSLSVPTNSMMESLTATSPFLPVFYPGASASPFLQLHHQASCLSAPFSPQVSYPSRSSLMNLHMLGAFDQFSFLSPHPSPNPSHDGPRHHFDRSIPLTPNLTPFVSMPPFSPVVLPPASPMWNGYGLGLMCPSPYLGQPSFYNGFGASLLDAESSLGLPDFVNPAFRQIEDAMTMSLDGCEADLASLQASEMNLRATIGRDSIGASAFSPIPLGSELCPDGSRRTPAVPSPPEAQATNPLAADATTILAGSPTRTLAPLSVSVTCADSPENNTSPIKAERSPSLTGNHASNSGAKSERDRFKAKAGGRPGLKVATHPHPYAVARSPNRGSSAARRLRNTSNGVSRNDSSIPTFEIEDTNGTSTIVDPFTSALSAVSPSHVPTKDAVATNLHNFVIPGLSSSVSAQKGTSSMDSGSGTSTVEATNGDISIAAKPMADRNPNNLFTDFLYTGQNASGSNDLKPLPALEENQTEDSIPPEIVANLFDFHPILGTNGDAPTGETKSGISETAAASWSSPSTQNQGSVNEGTDSHCLDRDTTGERLPATTANVGGRRSSRVPRLSAPTAVATNPSWSSQRMEITEPASTGPIPAELADLEQAASAAEVFSAADRPHVCSTCGISFKRLQDLKRHGLTHDTVKRFRCTLGCPTLFTRNDALQRHIRVKRCLQRSAIGPLKAKRKDEDEHDGFETQTHSHEEAERVEEEDTDKEANEYEAFAVGAGGETH